MHQAENFSTLAVTEGFTLARWILSSSLICVRSFSYYYPYSLLSVRLSTVRIVSVVLMLLMILASSFFLMGGPSSFLSLFKMHSRIRAQNFKVGRECSKLA